MTGVRYPAQFLQSYLRERRKKHESIDRDVWHAMAYKRAGDRGRSIRALRTYAGGTGMICGAIMSAKGILICSRAEKTADEVRLFGIGSAGAQVLTVHRGSGEIFALGVSVVW